MSNILAFDTATNACTVALQLGDKVLMDHRIIPRQHSKQLLPMIAQLLDGEQLTIGDLDAIACGIGPGSFMGVRLAVSVAQGLAYAQQVPIIPLSTLQVVAQTAYQKNQAKQVLSAWDARMDELYWGAYRYEDGVMRCATEDQLSKPGDWQWQESGRWLCAGNAWSVYQHQLQLPEQVLMSAEASDLYPEAGAMLSLAQHALDAGETVDALSLQPNYIRQQVVSGPPKS